MASTSSPEGTFKAKENFNIVSKERRVFPLSTLLIYPRVTLTYQLQFLKITLSYLYHYVKFHQGNVSFLKS